MPQSAYSHWSHQQKKQRRALDYLSYIPYASQKSRLRWTFSNPPSDWFRDQAHFSLISPFWGASSPIFHWFRRKRIVDVTSTCHRERSGFVRFSCCVQVLTPGSTRVTLSRFWAIQTHKHTELSLSKSQISASHIYQIRKSMQECFDFFFKKIASRMSSEHVAHTQPVTNLAGGAVRELAN